MSKKLGLNKGKVIEFCPCETGCNMCIDGVFTSKKSLEELYDFWKRGFHYDQVIREPFYFWMRLHKKDPMYIIDGQDLELLNERPILINMTPHDCHVDYGNGETLTILPEKSPARCEEFTEVLPAFAHISGINIPVTRKRYGKSDLPEECKHIYYIVSLPVAISHPERNDIFIPGEAIRDEKNRVIGCKGLSKYW